MLEKFDKDDKILLACDLGGLLDSNLVKAVSSNTFEAMFMLKQAGFTNVKYLQVSNSASASCIMAAAISSLNSLSVVYFPHHPKQRVVAYGLTGLLKVGE